MHRSRFFAIFQFLAPKKIIRGLSPHLGTTLKTTFPLSFDKSFMKIRSAVNENGCLIFMHFVVANGKRRRRRHDKNKKAQLTQGLGATAPSFQDGRQPPSWILSNPK